MAAQQGVVVDALRKLRLHCLQNRIRVSMFFSDFDRLRSGTVTPDQFMRALHMCALSRVLSDEDVAALREAYRVERGAGKIMVNYAEFCDAIDSVFTKKKLEKAPGLSSDPDTDPASVLATRQRDNELTTEEWDTLRRLTVRFVAEVRSRGLILKEFFRDFDRHRSGKVTQPQFQRAFPFRLDPAEFAVMLKRYQSTEQFSKGDIQYVRWVEEVDRIIGGVDKAPEPMAPSPTRAQLRREHDEEQLLRELRRQVRQSRLRVDEALRDYDKLRTGFVTVSQFHSALGRLRFQKFELTAHSLKLLSDRYGANDPQGYPKVAYHRFVDDMEEVFTVKGMEKSPSKKMAFDPDMFKNEPKSNQLPDEDEARVEQIIARIRSAVRTRRILLKPMFQDFDRAAKGVYQTRYTSRKRLHRVLAINNIHLTQEEADLLAEKYEAKDAGNSTDNINYVLLCSDLEPPDRVATSTTQQALGSQKKFIRTGKRGVLELQEVLEDVQTQVLTNRVRLAEFFRDFDQLRSGVITAAQFASGLGMARVELDPGEVKLLVGRFASEKRAGGVRWQDFCDFIDEVHTCKGLERQPKHVSNTQQAILRKREQEKEPIQDEQIYKVLALLRETVRAKGVLLPPFFKDFDTHNTGRISVSQLSQVLSRHGFPLSVEQVQLIVKCYEDPRTRDVNYRALVRDIDASEDPVLQNRLAEAQRRRQMDQAAGCPLPTGFGFTEGPPPVDVEGLLEQIRSTVVKSSVRMIDFFKDADKLRKCCVPSAKFRGGLSVAGIRLAERELQMLEAEFAGSLDGSVDYPRFCDAVSPETADRGLEKSPTKTRTPYRPTRSNPLRVNRTGESETQKAFADAAMDKVRSIVAARRVLARPVFLDFDKTRRGRVSPTQFAAVLHKLSLRLPDDQTQAVIARYIDDRGDVDYTSFCKDAESTPTA
eukprot:TRINITY_DN12502_c1_g2_i1.p1 TRINITY_DN12502_c1_g2~~TRINITY_DN12502_c1_g2_i1.p1  ORF type:complete len:931 (+),score=363.39 TRINITY_DN12502_c1_g2_i1:69-2861(+)